jgi:hypothetical protein
MPERPSHHDSGPDHPSELPPELAEFLRGQEIAALLHGTENEGTVLVVKAPRREIRSVQGRVPIELRHELYQHPAAPVVRVVTRIYDHPDSSLGLETFINVEDPNQRADYAALAEQDHLVMLFYDERLRHQLTKRVGTPNPEAVTEVLTTADRLLDAIPADRRDFNQAKADVMARTQL